MENTKGEVTPQMSETSPLGNKQGSKETKEKVLGEKKPETVSWDQLKAEAGKKETKEKGQGEKKPETASGNRAKVEAGKKETKEKSFGEKKPNRDIDKKPEENEYIEGANGKISSAKDEVFDDSDMIRGYLPKDMRVSAVISRAVGLILEILWTAFKLAVVVTVFTVVAGFFLSRDLMIRGRNGNRKSMEGMVVSNAVYTNKSGEEERVQAWLDSVTREKLILEADYPGKLKFDNSCILVARQVVVDEKSKKWAVVLHGYNGNMEDIYDIAMHYTDAGYNVLMPDLRGNGESEGSFLGMGWLDRLDVIKWIDVILEKNPSAQIVIHGVDTGSDAALMLSGEAIKSSVKAIVADGAYPRAWDVVQEEYEARHEKLPVFPFMYTMNPVMKVWAGYSLKEADAVKQVSNTNVPVLLIRGKGDTYVTEDMTKELNEAIASPHELAIIETGTHEDCRYAEPEQYYKKTFGFLDQYVK